MAKMGLLFFCGKLTISGVFERFRAFFGRNLSLLAKNEPCKMGL